MSIRHTVQDPFDLATPGAAEAPPAAPGKRSMTQGMAPRPIVFRVESEAAARALGAAFAPRDASGVAAGAEAAVDRAAGSSGEPLREDVRARFEGSLGADLSAVRVHRSADSEVASAAVGAKAYTVGNDIHFGAGNYQPDDPFGMHLLAHEVAHTVQQAGGAASGRQHKLEVSSTGDACEHEADAAADAMVAGRPARVGGASGLARKEEDAPAAATEVSGATLTQLNQIYNENVQAKGKVAGAGDPGAITKAIGAGDGAGMAAAGTAAAAALAVAETQVKQSEARLQTYALEVHRRSEWQRAMDAQKALDEAIGQTAAKVMAALVIPGTASAVGGDGGKSDAVTWQWMSLQGPMMTAGRLRGQAVAASGLKGKAQTDAAQGVRTALLSIPAADVRYCQSVIKSAPVAPAVLAIIEGQQASLAGGGAADLSAGGGDASGDAQKPGGPSGGKTLEIPAGGDATATITPDKGQVGLKGKGESVDGGGSLDLMNEQGELAFEGVKFDVGYQMPGGVKVTANGGVTQSVNPPMWNGKSWTVSYSVEASGGVGGGISEGPGGATGGISGSKSGGGTKVFADQAAATAFYQRGAAGDYSLPMAAKLAEMKEGESVSVGDSYGVEAGGSVGSFGGSVSGGEGSDIKLTKKEGKKVQVTIRESDNFGVGLSASGPVIGVSGGSGTGSAKSTTVTFDLTTEAGEAAYSAWQANPDKAPPAGGGVTVVSTGKGESNSKNVGGSLLIASGSTTATTSEFVETTADGQHSLTTASATATDSSKDLALDKIARSDTLEATRLDKEETAFAIKTTINTSAATDGNRQLSTILGEEQVGGGGNNITGAMSDQKGSGPWSIERSYSKKEMDTFMKKVALDQAALTPSSRELKAQLDELGSGASDEAKQKLLMGWFSEKGGRAAEDVFNTVGAPKLSVSLANDTNITGAAGQAVFDGKMTSIEDKLLDPKLDAAGAAQLLREVQGLYAQEDGRRSQISDPTRYADLPDGLRHELVKQVAANQGKVQQLRSRVAAMAKVSGAGDVDADPEIQTLMVDLLKQQEIAIDHRRIANDRRRKHDGAGQQGAYSARNRIHSGGSNDATESTRALYRQADQHWSEGLASLVAADLAWQRSLRCDRLSDESQKQCKAAASEAILFYRAAGHSFGLVQPHLDTVHNTTRSQMENYFGGYYTDVRGGLD